jgi:Loader and inhibitor of phage G40P
MMTRDQVKDVFKTIKFAYPQFEVSPEKLNFWHKNLNDQNPASVMRKTEQHVKEKPFPPTIADLRERKQREDASALAKFWKDDAK